MKYESEVQAKIIDYLEKISYVRKVHVSNRGGTLDIFGCYKGRFYSIEVKRPGETPTTLQYVNMRDIRKHGGIAFSAESLEDVKTYFDKISFHK